MHNHKYIFIQTVQLYNISHELFLQLFPLVTHSWMFSYNAWFPVPSSLPIWQSSRGHKSQCKAWISGNPSALYAHSGNCGVVWCSLYPQQNTETCRNAGIIHVGINTIKSSHLLQNFKFLESLGTSIIWILKLLKTQGWTWNDAKMHYFNPSSQFMLFSPFRDPQPLQTSMSYLQVIDSL